MDRQEKIKAAAVDTLSRFINSGMLQEVHDFVFAFKCGAAYADRNPIIHWIKWLDQKPPKDKDIICLEVTPVFKKVVYVGKLQDLPEGKNIIINYWMFLPAL